MTRNSIPLFALAALAATSPAFASDEETIVSGARQTLSRHVSFADLNLAKAEDVATLQGRVRRAANAVCIDNRVRDLATLAHGVACRSDAIERAEPQIAAAISRAGSDVAMRAISVTRSAE